MPAVLFGSISTVADTSELQRQAFNDAFAEHGLDWSWDREGYRAMLDDSGGANRIAAYAASRGESVDAKAVHATKSALFQKSLADGGLTPRPGVVETVRAAKGGGLKVGLVTTTTPENVTALLGALAPELSADDFDVVLDLTAVDEPKPDGAVYRLALERLGELPDSVVAIEDNVGGLAAAVATGLICVAFPNQNTVGHDFAGAATEVDALDPAALVALTQHS